jgi:hypothetical protein
MLLLFATAQWPVDMQLVTKGVWRVRNFGTINCGGLCRNEGRMQRGGGWQNSDSVPQ